MFPKSHLAQSLIHILPETRVIAQMMSYIVQNFIVLYDILLHIYHAFFVSLRLRDVDLYITHFWRLFHCIMA